jgi:hypothetical protein
MTILLRGAIHEGGVFGVRSWICARLFLLLDGDLPLPGALAHSQILHKWAPLGVLGGFMWNSLDHSIPLSHGGT